MNLSKTVFSDSAFSAFRVIINTLRGIIIIPIITNLLGAGSYGVWTTVLAFVALLSSTGGLHLHGSLIRYGAQDKLNEQTYSDVLTISSLVGTTMFIFVIITGAVLDVSAVFNGEISHENHLVISSSLLVFSSILLQVNMNFPRSKGHVKFYDTLQIIRKILEIVILFAIFVVGGSVTAGIFGLASVMIVLNIGLISYIFRKYNIPLPNFDNFPKYLTYSLPMVPKELSTSLLNNIDKYLILYFMSPAAVGAYAVARGVSASLTKFTAVLAPTLYPSISNAWDRDEKGQIFDLYSDIFRFYSIFAIPSLFGLTYLSYALLLAISTNDIANQAEVLIPILASGFLIRGYDKSIQYILTATEQTRKIAIAVGTSVVLNFVLNIVAIPMYGLIGAAVATTLSQVTISFLIIGYSSSYIEIPLPISSLTRSTIAAVSMIFVLLLVDIDHSPYVSIMINTMMGIVVYFVTLSVLGEFSPRELKILKKYVQGVKYFFTD